MMRIPKTVSLPWYKVCVRIVPRDLIADGVDGDWDRDPRVIQIAEDLTLPQQRYVLYHELTHALNDATDTYLDTWTMSERSRTTHNPTNLVSVGGVGVTAPLAVNPSPVSEERPVEAGHK